MTGLVRRVAWIAAALLIALAGAGWWIATSQSAFEWLAAELVRRSHGTLTIDGARGSPFGRIAARRVVFETADLRVTLQDVELDIAPRALLHGGCAADLLAARALRIETRPSAKPAPPATLALPLPVSIAKILIAQVQVDDYALRDVAFAYDGDARGHTVRELTADTDLGRIALDLRIAGDTPFDLSGAVTLAAREGTQVRADVSGTLLSTAVALSAESRGARARATAQLAAFEPRWLAHLDARIAPVNLAAFDSRLPHTRFEFDVAGASAADGLPAGSLTGRNLQPGTFAAGRVPVVALRADYALQREQADLSNLHADLGAAGTLTGSAHIGRNAGRAALVVKALDLRGLHGKLRATRLNGTAHVEFTPTEQRLQAQVMERAVSLAFDAIRRGDLVTVRQFRATAGTGTIAGSGEAHLGHDRRYAATATLTRLDPSKFGAYPQASINGALRLDGTLEPAWHANAALRFDDSRYRGVRLAGSVAGSVSQQGVRDVKIALAAGANALHADGSFGRPGDALAFTLEGKRLADLDPRLAGAVTASGRVTGDARQPGVDVDIDGTALGWNDSPRVATLRAHASGTGASHTAAVQARGDGFDFKSRVEGTWNPESGWSGRLMSFENAGTYPVTLAGPMPMALGRERLTAGPGTAHIAGGRLALAALSWQNGRLDTRGELANLPVAPFLALAGLPAAQTDLRLGGRWVLAATPRLNGTVVLNRETGDLVVPGDTPLPLRLEKLRLEARVTDGAVDAALELTGQSVAGRVRAVAGSLARDAPLALNGRLATTSLRLLDPLVGTRAVVTGNAVLELAAKGTLAAPRLTGTLTAAELGIEAPQFGVRLRGGTLRAELGESALTLRQFVIRAGAGRLTAAGTMSRATDETRLEWRAENLQALDRPDMRLKIDGSGTLGVAGKKVVLRGALQALQGYFGFDNARSPKLGDDVVVVGRPRAAAPAGARKPFEMQLLDADVTLDLGKHVHVVGAGVDTDLGGKLRVQTTRQGLLEARGTLTSTNGVYYAFGQRLEIERGRLIFDGPLDNPALDILAKRRNFQIEAGVEMTGTAQVPHLQLVSQPPVPDSEKLAWLTLGHGLQDASGADILLLQSAAGSLVSGGNSLPLTRRLANRVGLDDFSLRGSGSAGTQVAALGKRFSDRLYLEFQQGLAATSTALRLSYVLTRALSLRLETGLSNSVGIYFSRSYD